MFHDNENVITDYNISICTCKYIYIYIYVHKIQLKAWLKEPVKLTFSNIKGTNICIKYSVCVLDT